MTTPTPNMWLHWDRLNRRMEDGREAFSAAKQDKIPAYQRIRGYLMNQRDFCGIQAISWATDTNLDEIEDALLKMEKEGKVCRDKEVTMLSIKWYRWRYIY